MIKVEHIETWGFEHAIRGMRNPLASWNRSDTIYDPLNIGPQDLNLMQRLYQAGSEHRKYLRQIFVSADITAPRYFWEQIATYKIGTVFNSESTMHTIHKKRFTLSDFSYEHMDGDDILFNVIEKLNEYRDQFLITNDKTYWWRIIQLLPQSYNQKRTMTFNYENAVSIVKQRTGHKLDEWQAFITELKKLPYLIDIMGTSNG